MHKHMKNIKIVAIMINFNIKVNKVVQIKNILQHRDLFIHIYIYIFFSIYLYIYFLFKRKLLVYFFGVINYFLYKYF